MNIDLAIQDLKAFDGGVVDTSSLIYLQKLSVLTITASLVSLYILPQVREEFSAALPSSVLGLDVVGPNTDAAVVLAARTYGLPVISEDKRILRQAKYHHVPCFNSLMLLLYLHFRQAVDELYYWDAVGKLQGFARYGAEIYAFAETVFTTMKSRGDLSAFSSDITEDGKQNFHNNR